MENASKALLIAAGTLVVILVVTFGIKTFNSTSDSMIVAKDTGKAIDNQTAQATDYAISGITGATMNSSESTSNKFTFTIGFPNNKWQYENRTFTAEEGMTWKKWCASSYNINNDFYIDRKSCIVSNSYGLRCL